MRVKFIGSQDPREWRRYFPAEDGRWGSCEFVFDRDETDYDWLVVYADLPPIPGQSRQDAVELLRCPREQTLLVTTEPESIKAYGRAFTAQFGHVLTSQPAWALPHPHRHYRQAANHWFFGSGNGHWMSRAELERGPTPADKIRGLSVVHSPKRQWHTLHAQRFRFIEALRALLPDMEVFGRGAIPLDDKAEALAPFRYHLAVENHIGPHHITEKLTDALLGRCLAFYAGAPNAADYFPAESFVPIDVRDPGSAARTIREAMASNEWERRLPAIEEARRRVLEQEHVFAVVERIIAATHGVAESRPGAVILGRHAWRRRYRAGALMHVVEKAYVRVRSLSGKLRT
jgi:hypothetical protein